MTTRKQVNASHQKPVSRRVRDYKRMNEAELKKAMTAVHRQLAQRVLDRTATLRREYSVLLSRIEREMEPYGVSAQEFLTLPTATLKRVLTSGVTRAVAARAAPRYQHPENPELTWAGRGARPKWLRDLVAQGHEIDAFRVRRGQK